MAVNEPVGLVEDPRRRRYNLTSIDPDMVSLVKSAVEDVIARSRYGGKVQFPALSPVSWTSNYPPARDRGLRERHVFLEYTQEDHEAVVEKRNEYDKDVKPLLTQFIYNRNTQLGKAIIGTIMELWNRGTDSGRRIPDALTGVDAWNIIGAEVLKRTYKRLGLDPPEWAYNLDYAPPPPGVLEEESELTPEKAIYALKMAFLDSYKEVYGTLKMGDDPKTTMTERGAIRLVLEGG
jgi:hypothetical protein